MEENCGVRKKCESLTYIFKKGKGDNKLDNDNS